jgi:hypothetical protein
MRRESIATGLLTGCLLWLIIACFCIGLLGCASSKPCLPEVEIQEVTKEVRCFAAIDFPPPPEYEAYPEFDSENAKEWSLEVERITQANRAKSRAWIAATLGLLSEHNELEPQCKQ